MTAESIGEIICQNRQNRKMTQEEFAYRLGVTPQAVSKWERGNGLPDISLIEGICTILQISANVLLGISQHRVIENSNAAMEQEIKNNMFSEPLTIEFGEAVIPYITAGLETEYVNQKRKKLVQDTGILMPLIRMRDNADMEQNAYRILIYDKIFREGTIKTDTEDIYTALISQTAEICRENFTLILNKQIVKTMIDNLKALYPGIADGLVPEKISYLQVERQLQSMLRQGKSIRDMIHILEEMEEMLFSGELC